MWELPLGRGDRAGVDIVRREDSAGEREREMGREREKGGRGRERERERCGVRTRCGESVDTRRTDGVLVKM